MTLQFFAIINNAAMSTFAHRSLSTCEIIWFLEEYRQITFPKHYINLNLYQHEMTVPFPPNTFINSGYYLFKMLLFYP